MKSLSLPSILKRELNYSPFVSFDTLFEEILKDTDKHSSNYISTFGKQTYPKVNIIEEDDKIIIHAGVPGLTSEDIKICVEDDILTLSGNKADEQLSTDKGTYLKRELHRSSFRKSWYLGENIDQSSITASTKDGILSIFLTKKIATSNKKREISISQLP
jgi:HSP20 family protein